METIICMWLVDSESLHIQVWDRFSLFVLGLCQSLFWNKQNKFHTFFVCIALPGTFSSCFFRPEIPIFSGWEMCQFYGEGILRMRPMRGEYSAGGALAGIEWNLWTLCHPADISRCSCLAVDFSGAVWLWWGWDENRDFSRFSDILVCLLCHLELLRSSSNRTRQSRNLLSSAPALRASQSSNNRSCIIYAAFATFWTIEIFSLVRLFSECCTDEALSRPYFFSIASEVRLLAMPSFAMQ